MVTRVKDIGEVRETENNEDANQVELLQTEIKKLSKENKYRYRYRFDQVLEDRNELEKETEEIKRNYEIELSELREDFRKEKAEKEHLRIRNKLLQDMSQIIVEKCLKPSEQSKVQNKKKTKDDIEIIEEVFHVNEEDENDNGMLGELIRNKNNGYR